VRAWLLRVRWYSRRQLAASGSRKSASASRKSNPEILVV
jgi:hypothetical protein